MPWLSETSITTQETWQRNIITPFSVGDSVHPRYKGQVQSLTGNVSSQHSVQNVCIHLLYKAWLVLIERKNMTGTRTSIMQLFGARYLIMKWPKKKKLEGLNGGEWLLGVNPKVNLELQLHETSQVSRYSSKTLEWNGLTHVLFLNHTFLTW